MGEVARPFAGDAHLEVDRECGDRGPDHFRGFRSADKNDHETEDINGQDSDGSFRVKIPENGRAIFSACELLEKVSDKQKSRHDEKEPHAERSESRIFAGSRHQVMKKHHDAGDAAQGIELMKVGAG